MVEDEEAVLNSPKKATKSTLFCMIEGIIILALVGLLLVSFQNKKTEISLLREKIEQTQIELGQAKNDLVQIKLENSKLQREIKDSNSDSLAENVQLLTEKNSLKETIKQLEQEKESEAERFNDEIAQLKRQIKQLSVNPEELYEQASSAFKEGDYTQAKDLLDQVFSVYQSKKNESKYSVLYSKTTEAIEKEKDKILKSKYISKDYKFMQEVTWYNTTRKSEYKESNYQKYDLSLYCGKFDNGATSLRLKAYYYGNDWIFIDKIQFKNVDGINLYFDVSQNREGDTVYGGSIMEWVDILVNSEVDNLRKLLKSKTIYVKLHGKYPREWEMTKEQKTIFKEMLDLYDSLKTIE